MVALSYSAKRSEFAKAAGLGTRTRRGAAETTRKALTSVTQGYWQALRSPWLARRLGRSAGVRGVPP